jgi:hypothetical protein
MGRGSTKFESRNSKWFDRPFDRLTVLSRVEGLTTLRKVKGQITMIVAKWVSNFTGQAETRMTHTDMAG